MTRMMKNSNIDWIGQIPQNWKVERLSFHLKEINEKNYPVKTTNVLSLTNKLGVIPYEEKGNQGNKAKENYEEYKIAYKDTIIANSMNILIGSVGYSNYDGCVSPVYYVFREKGNNSLKFINYIMQTSEFQKELKKYANGILEIRLRLSSSDILKRPIAFPNYIEQQNIVKFLDEKCKEIDNIIKNTKQSIEEYKKLKQSVITKAVTKGIRQNRPLKDSGIKWIGEIPEDWNIKRLRFIANKFLKGNGITKDDVKSDGNIKCVRYGEIYSKYNYTFNDCLSCTNVEEISTPQYFSYGDLLFAGTGELIEEIGKSIVYLGNDKCLAGGDIIIVKHDQNPSFLNYSLNSDSAIFQKSRNKIKLKVVHISATEIKNIILPLPPLEEQKEIAQYLDDKCSDIDALIEQKQKFLTELANYKKSLIYEYVTGKKEVS